jgi:hypothetical protein
MPAPKPAVPTPYPLRPDTRPGTENPVKNPKKAK